jgi:thioredoxin-like negative regulator of GroEL
MSEFADKKQSHLFQPGQSGNPRGKPPGTRSKVLAELDRLGAQGAQQVLAAVLHAAQQGDVAAAAIILKRCWPEFRGRPVRLKLPAITTATDVVAASAAIVSAVAGGRISPEEGQAVSAVIETQRRAMETVELAARIEALEKNTGSR